MKTHPKASDAGRRRMVITWEAGQPAHRVPSAPSDRNAAHSRASRTTDRDSLITRHCSVCLPLPTLLK